MMFQGRGKSLRVFVIANNLAIGDNVKYTKYVLYELYVFDQFHIIDKLNRKANCFITERIVYITIYLIICCVCCCCLCLLTPMWHFVLNKFVIKYQFENSQFDSQQIKQSKENKISQGFQFIGIPFIWDRYFEVIFFILLLPGETFGWLYQATICPHNSIPEKIQCG